MLLPFLASLPSDDELTDFIRDILEKDYMLFRSIALSQLGGDEDAAADSIHQMIDIMLAKKAHIYKHPKPAAYVTKILKNCIKKQREKKKHLPEFCDISAFSELLPAPDDDLDDDIFVTDADIEAAKERILSQLSPDERALYETYVVQGKASREISEMLGVSDAAVRTRIKRLKIKIRMLAAGFFT